jgi:hypothetical protein
VGIKKAGRSEDTENLNVPSEMMMVKGKGTDEVRERLPLGWTPSPAYPGRLGVAGSVLIVLLLVPICNKAFRIRRKFYRTIAHLIRLLNNTSIIIVSQNQVSQGAELPQVCPRTTTSEPMFSFCT